MTFSHVFKYNPYHDKEGRFTSDPEHPTVEVMRQAMGKLGAQGFEDAVVAHLESLGRDLSAEDLAHEVEYIARKTMGLTVKTDDYSAADPSPAPSVTSQDLAESGGLRMEKPPKKKGWLQRVRDKFKRVPLDVQPIAKGFANVFDKRGN